MSELNGTFVKMVAKLVWLLNRFQESEQISTKSACFCYQDLAKILTKPKIKGLECQSQIFQ